MKDAIKIFEQSLEGKEGTGPKSAVDCEDVRLCRSPSRRRASSSASINTLKKCKHLRLSTNSIDKMIPLDLDNLEILSMGRNQIKRIEGLDNVKDTLKQLWLSYNGIAVLAGVEKLVNLEVLYLSNCKVASSEGERQTAQPGGATRSPPPRSPRVRRRRGEVADRGDQAAAQPQDPRRRAHRRRRARGGAEG